MYISEFENTRTNAPEQIIIRGEQQSSCKRKSIMLQSSVHLRVCAKLDRYGALKVGQLWRDVSPTLLRLARAPIPSRSSLVRGRAPPAA